ncbi:DUF1641 domain-containing protein [Bacillus thermotolerans]|uniref:DUF1641 domain-containing protein n=1 Tax=Bacillus thermotolerans TaxID=1221996 RepID=A0A0F5HX86_BACTR|nr:DUF1641 domain-containing protein [Bacillus thermotolerans]KKB38009.1 hypothetical protein QY97_03384 [Bacillus thermotolerans]KKB40670.1 hypothetical protein QY95_01244 [Bacillus thermotolerans]KKB43795.1 hypothetical protein QY96_00564 [Bacillus thermotolerans]
MAKAITKIRPMEISEEEQRRRDLEEVENLLIEHKEALKAFLDMLDKANKSGGIELAAGLFDQKDEVMDVLVRAAYTPGATKMLRNSLLLIGMLGKIDMEKLEPIIVKLNGGLDKAVQWSEGERSIIRLFGDVNWKESLLFLLSFFKGASEAGKEPASAKRKAGWFAIAAGVSLAGAAVLAKKRNG